ncbi:hypothetical protein M9435_004873 [Picochlorum sp. BPE23]|nr:hypothetical protein M9435_004873 [Picochlorum sp. BPE23]
MALGQQTLLHKLAAVVRQEQQKCNLPQLDEGIIKLVLLLEAITHLSHELYPYLNSIRSITYESNSRCIV